MKYIYASFSKCGTKTMAEAFRILGFKVCDFEESMLDCGEMWSEYYNEHTSETRRIECLREGLKDFDVCMDAPCFHNWNEIMQAFPEAKCIFYERPEDSWIKSMMNQLDANRKVGIGKLPDWCLNVLGFTGFFPNERYLMAYVMKRAYPAFLGAYPLYGVNWKGEIYPWNQTLLKRAYRVHNADFIRNCPDEKRLILGGLDCGWKVICDFVGRKIPDVDFPHMNKKGSVVEKTFNDSRFTKVYGNHARKWFRKVLLVSFTGTGLFIYRKELKQLVKNIDYSKIFRK